MNLKKALDKEYEAKNLTINQILDLPVNALQGITEEQAELLKKALKIKTIKDLGKNKYFRWASSLVNLADAEEAK
ncbi:MAG: hypothetical protein NZ853_04540 [Leptospiraceae bacterium]|nr:hypothetical protein [Leptospiraceae bacterium]MDW7975443.1 hypothetical protein [Leptospiraceae bacterium]